MICPKCKRSFYFLEQIGRQDKALCKKCGYRGAPQLPDYSHYHENLYLAKAYTRTPQTDPQMRRIFSALQIQPHDTVVDLGCGVGDYTKTAAQFARTVTGYDRDVRGAKKKYPGISFSELDFGKGLPISNGSVDKIISINVIEHLPDPLFFLKECARILKPGGMIALSTANLNFLLHDLHHDMTHFYEWTVEEFDRLTAPYFHRVFIAKDCSMFKFYPLNLALQYMLKPDITYIGRK